MKKENIIVLQAVVHVLDSSVGMPVLSDCPVDLTSMKTSSRNLPSLDGRGMCLYLAY